MPLWPASLALALVLCAPEAHAVPTGPARGLEQKTKKKRPGARHTRVKENLPPGWSWPPNRRMRKEGERCLARLRELGIAWKKAPRTRKVATPIYVPDMEVGGVRLAAIWKRGPFVMDCHLAEAFASGGAPALRALGVREVRFAQIHDYRTVRGRGRRGRRVLSRHALGLAVDVYELVTEDGLKHVVKSDYGADRLLTDAEAAMNASGAYRLVLSPGNDPSHWDHFHFEARTTPERRRAAAGTAGGVAAPAALPAQ